MVSAASRGGSAVYISNDAEGQESAIAPGELVDIFGISIGPTQAVSATAASGKLPSALGGLEVLFNGYAAPLVSAGPNQIRAIVPFETMPALPYPTQPVEVQVLASATAVAPFTTNLASQVSSVFTVDGSPAGQSLMINQDGTLNSAQNPAPAGSIVTIYATGLNNTDPPLASDQFATAAAPLGLLSQLTWTGLLYAGAAPGLSASITQINFRVPNVVQTGQQQIPLAQQGVYYYAQATGPTASIRRRLP